MSRGAGLGALLRFRAAQPTRGSQPPVGSALVLRDEEAAGEALEQLIWDPRETSQQKKIRDGDFAAKALGGEPRAPAQQAQQRKGGTRFSSQRGKGSTTSPDLSPEPSEQGGGGLRRHRAGEAQLLPPAPHPWEDLLQSGRSTQHPIEKGHPQHHKHVERCPAMPSEAGGHEGGGDTALMSPKGPLGWED